MCAALKASGTGCPSVDVKCQLLRGQLSHVLLPPFAMSLFLLDHGGATPLGSSLSSSASFLDISDWLALSRHRHFWAQFHFDNNLLNQALFLNHSERIFLPEMASVLSHLFSRPSNAPPVMRFEDPGRQIAAYHVAKQARLE